MIMKEVIYSYLSLVGISISVHNNPYLGRYGLFLFANIIQEVDWMSIYRNLKPHAYTLKLMGGTGDGKTEIATVCATKEARRILMNCIGRTNSTLRNRVLVYSEEYKDKIVVAAKVGGDIFERGLFSDMVAQSWAKVVKSQGKVVASIIGKDEDDFEQYLIEEINGKNNARAILSFLEENQKKDFVDAVINVYRLFSLHEHNYAIYNTVKNSLNETEVKENSAKFLSAIKEEVGRVLDMLGENFRAELWNVWKSVNQQLQEVFFEYFDKDNKSDDGYYYKELDLSIPDERFIDAMFTANDVQKGQRLSLEVLCGEIVIYLPVNEAIVKMINNLPTAKEVFKNSQGKTVFAVMDTRGLYHSDNTEDDNTDYLDELLYQGEADALLMVVPLFGDSNEKKIEELYKKAFKNFNKQIPVFMLHNKLDLFVDSINKDSFDDDPLSLEMEGGTILDAQELITKIEEREGQLRTELQNVQGKARKNLMIKSLSCYLKRDKTMQPELVKKYNIINAFEIIFRDTADYLKDSAVKIPLIVGNSEYDDVYIEVDKEIMVKAVKEQILKDTTDKKVFDPGMKDLATSIGKVPHGNAYNALKRRLRYGDGYTSNINEEYYYNCKSFSVNFTANLRNFVTDDMLNKIISQGVHVRGGKFMHADSDKFNEIVKRNVNAKELVSYLLYYQAMLEAEKTAFSFGGRFQNFLQKSMLYFNRTQIDSTKYEQGVYLIIKDAAEHTLMMNVTYR